MQHRRQLLWQIARVLVTLLMLVVMASTAYAALSVEYQDGPRYNSGTASYLIGACSDTSSGEGVKIQYTIDNADLTNPPDTGNGSKLPCSLTTETTCASRQYWLCSLPATAGVTYKYRFYVMSATNQYYGLVSEQRSFTTSYLAVETERLVGASGNPMGWFAMTAIGLGGAAGGIWFISKRKLRAKT